MKKIYQTPIVEVENMELEEMIASSIDIDGNYDGTSEIQSADDDDFWN